MEIIYAREHVPQSIFLTGHRLYAFDEFAIKYGWRDNLVLRSEREYVTYEEVDIPIKCIFNYNEIIAVTDKLGGL